MKRLKKNQGLKNWANLIRPKTLAASIVPVAIGLSAAYFLPHHNDLYPNHSDNGLVLGIATLLCALLLQITSNLINDYHDFKKGIDNPDRLGPPRATASGLISPQKVLWSYRLSALLAFILGIFLISHTDYIIALIGFSSLIAAFLYTAGPYPLSHHALGELFAYLFFGPIPVIGTYYIQEGMISTQSSLSILFLLGSLPGPVAATLMSVNNIRDFNSDSKTEKKTFIILIGQKNGRFFAVGCIALSAFIIIYLGMFLSPIFILCLIPPILFYKTWWGILNDPIDIHYNKHLEATGKFLLFYGAGISGSLLSLSLIS